MAIVKILNPDLINKLKGFNKIYIPTEYLNADYSYRFNNDYINIITNKNCHTQYNSTYCDCIMYNMKNNVASESYSCNISSNLPLVAYESITDDVNYSNTLRTTYINDTAIYLLMFVVALLFASFLLKERSHI